MASTTKFIGKLLHISMTVIVLIIAVPMFAILALFESDKKGN